MVVLSNDLFFQRNIGTLFTLDDKDDIILSASNSLTGLNENHFLVLHVGH